MFAWFSCWDVESCCVLILVSISATFLVAGDDGDDDDDDTLAVTLFWVGATVVVASDKGWIVSWWTVGKPS